MSLFIFTLVLIVSFVQIHHFRYGYGWLYGLCFEKRVELYSMGIFTILEYGIASQYKFSISKIDISQQFYTLFFQPHYVANVKRLWENNGFFSITPQICQLMLYGILVCSLLYIFGNLLKRCTKNFQIKVVVSVINGFCQSTVLLSVYYLTEIWLVSIYI